MKIRKSYYVCLVMAYITIVSTCSAGPIPGSSNEIRNGDFSDGFPGTPKFWDVEDTQVKIANVGNPEFSAACNNFLPAGEWGDRLSQVVDESLNPLWNPNLHQKVIDLQADLLGGGAGSGVRFQLEAWSESSNGSDTPPTSTPTFATDWVQYTNLSTTKWATVNPFDRMLLDFQPRWVRLNIEYMQPIPVIAFVDNVILTSQCVPEPSGLALLGIATLCLCAGGCSLRLIARSGGKGP